MNEPSLHLQPDPNWQRISILYQGGVATFLPLGEGPFEAPTPDDFRKTREVAERCLKAIKEAMS